MGFKPTSPTSFNPPQAFFGRLKQSSSGMAVVMALSVVLMMATVAMELHKNERGHLSNAAALRDRRTLNEMATSAVHLAMAMLAQDRIDSETDSLQENWADEEALATLLEEIPFEKGELKLQILDELGKIQINALVAFPEGRQFSDSQYKLWERFSTHLRNLFLVLEQMGEELGLGELEEELEDIEPVTIVNCIKDWLDSGDDEAITGLNGAESDHYESLDPPYACKNGPFDHLSEVRLVKGVTPQFFDGFGGVGGLGNYITVYGAAETENNKFTYPGKININTADQAVLAALLPSDNADYAELLVDHRIAVDGAEFKNNLASPTWYKRAAGFPADITIDPELITVSSDTFRIFATAKLDQQITTVTAVVQRQKLSESDHWRCKVLNWKQE